MKRTFILVLMMTLFSGVIVLSTPVTAEAQRSYYVRKVYRNGRAHYVRVRKPSYYRRHRNRINMALGTAGGAVLGGLIGGKKGALIGAGAGLGASALYTYKWNKKKRRYVKVRRY